MKNTLVRITLAALAVVLLGSCEKINQRIDALEERIDGIENEKIATISSQIASINSSIADLGTIRSNVTSLRSQVDDHSTDIFNLEEADRALQDRILNLEDYLDDVLPTYAEKDWVKATFSTLEQYEATCDTIAKIDARIGSLDEKLSKDIKDCVDSMKRWVNVQFEAYYTAAEMDAALEMMQADIDSAKAAGKITDERVDSLANELTKTKAAVDSAKAQLTREYKAAIDTAIKTSEGKLTKALTDAITKVNDDITALTTRVSNLEVSVATLTGRVTALEGMIQSVTIVPAYTDGSVKVDDKDSLYIDFIVSPASAVANLAEGNVTVLVNKVKTKAFAGVDSIKIGAGDLFEKDAAKGAVAVRVSVAGKIPAITDSTITVAVNVKNGVSNYTTEFVPITLPVRVSLDKHSIVVPISTTSRDTILTATVKNAKNNSVNWESTDHGVAAVNNQGKVTIAADIVGMDTIVVTTVEGAKTDTCFVTVIPQGALAGEFSVSATKKVRFSQGNLVATIDATGAPTAWKFAANQYESIGANVANTAIEKEAGDIDLFGWSTDAASNNWGIHTKTSPTNKFTTGKFKDWGKAVGDGNTWRTLSKAEWKYLFNNHSKKWATVNGVKGYVIAPDGFAGTLSDTYADDAALAANNLVFLPAAGDRAAFSVTVFGSDGFYWSSSSTDSDDISYDLHFTGSSVKPDRTDKRNIGMSVRLVTDVK